MGVELILWDSSRPAPLNEGKVYTWNGYFQKNSVCSILRYIENNDEQLRKKYIEFIFDMGESSINGKRIIDIFTIEDNLSFWWLTPFVEKNPWKCPEIAEAIRFFALEEILLTQKPSSLKLVSENKNIHIIVHDLCKNLNILYKWESNKKLFSIYSKKELFVLTPIFIRGLATLWRYLYTRWALRNVKKPKWNYDDNARFFCSNFFHLDIKKAKKGNFYSGYWGNLSKLLDEKKLNGNWLQLYYPSNEIPNTEVARKYIEKFNRKPNNSNLHIFLDSYLSYKVLINVIKNWLWIGYINFKLFNIENIFRPSNSYFTLWPIMRNNWKSSMYGSDAVTSLLWLELFNAALKEIPYQKKGFYLLENQRWERALIHAWRKYDHGQLIGVSHSTVRFWDLRYYNDPRLFDSSLSNQTPNPDLIALNGEVAINAFLSVDFNKERIVECEAIRYEYINNLGITERKNLLAEKTTKKLLILGDYMENATVRMFNLLQSAAPKISTDFTFTVKPHPNYLVTKEDYPSLEFDIVTDPLNEIIQNYDIAYTSNLTSAAVDAYLTGLPVIVMLDNKELNYSPLRNQNEVYFVSSSTEFVKALNSVGSTAEIKEIRNSYFFFDSEYPRWKKIL